MYTTMTVMGNRPNRGFRPEFTTNINRGDENDMVRQQYITMQIGLLNATGAGKFDNEHDGNITFYFNSRHHLATFIESLNDAYRTYDRQVDEAIDSMASLEYNADDRATFDQYVRVDGDRAVDVEGFNINRYDDDERN